MNADEREVLAADAHALLAWALFVLAIAAIAGTVLLVLGLVP